jgi:hypothetical protein
MKRAALEMPTGSHGIAKTTPCAASKSTKPFPSRARAGTRGRAERDRHDRRPVDEPGDAVPVCLNAMREPARPNNSRSRALAGAIRMVA